METILLLFLAAISGCTDGTSPVPTSNNAPPTTTSNNTNTDTSHMEVTDQPWRSDPALAGKFHPDYPDDLQVIVHEGGPRITKTQPELVWVHITGMQGNAYQGKLLNQPQQLPSLKQGDSILFLVANSAHEPFMVSNKYLEERSDWHIGSCNQCGMPELFDAPSDLQAMIFPDLPADAKVETFTSFCPLCGGVQIVSSSPIQDSP